jgi:hypothetical protein
VVADGQRTGTGCGPAVLVLNGHTLLGEQLPEATAVDGIETVFQGIDELAFEIAGGRALVYDSVSGRDLSEFDMVQVAGYPSGTAILLSALAEYLDYHRKSAINITSIGPPTKLTHCIRLTLAGLPVPATVSYPLSLLTQSYSALEDKFGLPFVLKAINASGGRFNHLITGEDDYHARLEQLGATRLLAQEFIPNDSTLRLLVLGGHVSLAMRRINEQSLYLTNTEQGGQAELLDTDDLDPAVTALATRAAALFDYDVAAVNLMQHWTTGYWHVLDVNYSPALATGAHVPQKLNAYAAYLKRRLSPPPTQRQA